MRKEDMILISVDDHIVEPPDMFADHLPKKYVDDAPRLVHNPDGSDMWRFRDTVIPNVALNAVAGRPKEEYGQRGRAAAAGVAPMPIYARTAGGYWGGVGGWRKHSFGVGRGQQARAEQR